MKRKGQAGFSLVEVVLTFAIMALTQVLGVGAVALIAQAVGRRDQADANLVFNQSVSLAVACALATLLGGYALAGAYVASIAADAATQAQGLTYLYWFLPGLALGFAQVVMGSALRGTGIVKPTLAIQALTVLLNTILAPILRHGRDETDEEGSPIIAGIRTAYVFDVEQTDGAPLPQPSEAQGNPGVTTGVQTSNARLRGRTGDVFNCSSGRDSAWALSDSARYSMPPLSHIKP